MNESTGDMKYIRLRYNALFLTHKVLVCMLLSIKNNRGIHQHANRSTERVAVTCGFLETVCTRAQCILILGDIKETING